MINIVSTEPDSDGDAFHASIHKELLCFYSPYYAAALKGEFSEAKKDTITLELPWDQAQSLVSWLYTGNILIASDDDLMGLYVFADEKLMLALRRSIMSRFVGFQIEDSWLDIGEATSYLKRLPQNSGLFHYLVDHWVGVWSHEEYDAVFLDGIPRAFFYKVLAKLGSIAHESRAPATIPKNPCNFHEHADYNEWLQSTSTAWLPTDIYSCADRSSLWQHISATREANRSTRR